MHTVNMILSPFYILILVFAGIFLLVFAYGLFSATRKRQPKTPIRQRGRPGDAGICPVCGTLLASNEQIKSALYPGQSDRICHIFGCPHCHPYNTDKLRRVCPVCKAQIPAEGYLIARFFERGNRKRHVHILGCTICRTPGRKK